MKLIDRYILTQMLGPFGFFTLVFTGVIWLTQSLRQIDAVIDNGESAAVFLEFTLLLLPRALTTILPLSAFGAAIYTLNKLYTESELVVMMTTGHNPTALVRPVVYFGVFAATVMYALTLFLVPISESQLSQRRFEINNKLVRLFLKEGEFVHPSDDVTLFIRDISQDGEMAGVFINDQRDPDTTFTYSADRALLLRDGETAQLALFEGSSLIYSVADGKLSTLSFKQFTYDLSQFLDDRQVRRRRPSEYFVTSLLFPNDEMIERDKRERSEFTNQAHEYLSSPLFALVAPAIALGAILFGGFRRGGFALRIGFGVAMIAFVQMSIVLANSLAKQAPGLIFVVYVPAALGFALALFLLAYSNDFQHRLRRRMLAR